MNDIKHPLTHVQHNKDTGHEEIITGTVFLHGLFLSRQAAPSVSRRAPQGSCFK